MQKLASVSTSCPSCPPLHLGPWEVSLWLIFLHPHSPLLLWLALCWFLAMHEGWLCLSIEHCILRTEGSPYHPNPLAFGLPLHFALGHGYFGLSFHPFPCHYPFLLASFLWMCLAAFPGGPSLQGGSSCLCATVSWTFCPLPAVEDQQVWEDLQPLCFGFIAGHMLMMVLFNQRHQHLTTCSLLGRFCLNLHSFFDAVLIA